MKRKLVKQGAATMMISLPSKWIKANKLGKGDEIDLEEENGQLIVGAEIKEGKKEINIKLNDENKKDIKNLLTHIYRRGFDKVILDGNHKESLKEIKNVTSELLLGFEITQIEKDKIIIENISEPTEQKYDIMFKKTFQIIKETQDIVNEDFEKNKFNNFEDIDDLKKQQDRFILFCRRLLTKGNTGKNQALHWELLIFLMHIQHRYWYLYDYVVKNKINQNKEIISLLNALKEHFNFYETAYFNQDINSIHKINKMKKEYYLGRCLKALEKSKGKENVVLAYIREIFRIMQIGTSPILSEILEN